MGRGRRRRATDIDIDLIDRYKAGDSEAVEALKSRLVARRASQNFPRSETDFVVKCGDYLWTFHKEEFAKKSEYFQVLTNSAFRVRWTTVT